MLYDETLADREYWSWFTGEEFKTGPGKNDIGDEVRTELESFVDPGKVMNIMCGKYGLIKSHLGLDISPHMLRKNKDLTHRVVCDLNADTSYPIRNEEFDTAVIINGIAYLRNPTHAFKEIARTLKLGGVLVVGFDHNQTRKGQKEWGCLNENDKLVKLQDLYSQAGFGPQIIKKFKVHWGFPNHDIRLENTFYLVKAEKSPASHVL